MPSTARRTFASATSRGRARASAWRGASTFACEHAGELFALRADLPPEIDERAGAVAGRVRLRAARSAWSGQLAKRRVRPGREDNLWQAVPGDHGARGRLSGRARAHSWQFWLTSHLAPVLGGTTAAAALVAIGLAAERAERARRVALRRRRRLAPA